MKKKKSDGISVKYSEKVDLKKEDLNFTANASTSEITFMQKIGPGKYKGAETKRAVMFIDRNILYVQLEDKMIEIPLKDIIGLIERMRTVEKHLEMLGIDKNEVFGRSRDEEE